MKAEEVLQLINALIKNEIPELKELIAELRGGDPELIHTVVSAFTNLRSHSDRPFQIEQFDQFIEITLAIFDVYVVLCERLVQERQEKSQSQRKTSEAASALCSPAMSYQSQVSPAQGQNQLSWADMNILLNSLRTYFMQLPSRKCYASERVRGHQLFTYNIFWKSLFNQALNEQSLEDQDSQMAFIALNAQVVVYVHLMRAFGLVEEDVRLWVQYYVNSSTQRYSLLKPAQISMFYEQVEAIFSAADDEENSLPLEVRNKIVRVLPNFSGYQCVYINPERLQQTKFEEEPLFNSEQEQLLKELTTLLSDPVEMKRLRQLDDRRESLTRGQLIQKLWKDECNGIPLFDDVVTATKAQNIPEMVDEYIRALYESKNDNEASAWDDESSQHDLEQSNADSHTSMIGRDLHDDGHIV